MNSRILPLYRRRAFATTLAASPLLIGRTRAYAQVGDINDAINKAGRQRMLSQRMAKLCLANALQVDPQGSASELGKARVEFIAALHMLRTAPEATPRIKDELALADGQWVFFEQGLQRAVSGQASPKLMSEVFVSSENLLTVMDRVTALYSGSSRA